MTSERGTRRSIPWFPGVIGLVAGLCSCQALLPSGGEDPEPVHELAFNHKIHLQNELECTDCHTTAKTKDGAGMPTLKACMECHEDAEEPKVKTYLAGIKARPKDALWYRFIKPNDDIIFSHAAHAKYTSCKDCHGDVATSVATGRWIVPTMKRCVSCHAERAADKNDCATCHRRTRKDIAPASHRGDWRYEHGARARARDLDASLEGTCGICHSRDTCLSCHRQIEPRSHTQFFRLRGHGFEASNDRDSCRTCHRTDFCVRCHEQTEPQSHRGSWGGTRDQHCLSCHLPLQGQGCAMCHKTNFSHNQAPPKPAWHNPGFNCRQCHGTTARLMHEDNGTDCNACHQ